jgi:hypothetical protein
MESHGSNMKKIEKRLADLECRFHRDVIILEMPDGSTETIIVGSGDGLIDLFGRSMQEMQAGAGFPRDVDMIRRSIGGTEKGGYMVELCRALLNSPATTEDEVSPAK